MSPKTENTSSIDYPLLARQLVQASGNGAACKLAAGLYLVATPIGNRGDITLRALTTLAGVDAIGCEDTRTSGLLLKAYGIKKPLFSLHDHNEDARRDEVLRRIAGGEAIAIISDAGMPAIADPGFRLARACHEAGVNVTVIPGANAALAALAGCGLPTDRFLFAGFLPPRRAARIKEIVGLKNVAASLVFYEAPQRLAECLDDLAATLGAQRPAAVARELTKLHEETRRGTVGALAAHYAAHPARGEIVIVVAGDAGDTGQDMDIDALLAERLRHVSLRDAVAEIAEMTGGVKKEIYARALALSADMK